MKVFISHSSVDRDAAEALAELLVWALGLRAEEIRCTSVGAYKLPAGAHTSTQLRDEIQGCAVLIGLLTPASLSSSYVLFELGARWGVERPLIPLLGPGADQSIVKAPLSEHHVARTGDRADMLKALSTIAGMLGTALRDPHIYDAHLAKLTALAAAPAAAGSLAPVNTPIQAVATPVYYYHFQIRGTRYLFNQPQSLFDALCQRLQLGKEFPIAGTTVQYTTPISIFRSSKQRTRGALDDSYFWEAITRTDEDVTHLLPSS